MRFGLWHGFLALLLGIPATTTKSFPREGPTNFLTQEEEIVCFTDLIPKVLAGDFYKLSRRFLLCLTTRVKL